jgi:DNA primase
MVRGRIVIPIYWNEQLVGWQARSLDPNEKTMKYATMPGFSKSKMLFNGDRAKKHKFGVVVEGVFDAFRVGDRAVALLGKSLSHTQQQLVLSWWGSGSLCVMLDPDAIEDAERITTLLNPNAYRMGVFSLTLPEDTDPADMDREVLERMIADHARSRGIPLIAL